MEFVVLLELPLIPLIILEVVLVPPVGLILPLEWLIYLEDMDSPSYLVTQYMAKFNRFLLKLIAGSSIYYIAELWTFNVISLNWRLVKGNSSNSTAGVAGSV